MIIGEDYMDIVFAAIALLVVIVSLFVFARD